MVWILPIFFIFRQFWLFFGNKKATKGRNQNNFFLAFSFDEKHLHTKLQKTSSNGLDFDNFLYFFVNLALFWPKKGQKMPKLKKVFFVEFSFIGKHLQTKFQKIPSNGLNFANFLHFCQFWLFFGHKKARKEKNPK